MILAPPNLTAGPVRIVGVTEVRGKNLITSVNSVGRSSMV